MQSLVCKLNLKYVKILLGTPGPARPKVVRAFLAMVSNQIKAINKKADALSKLENLPDNSLPNIFERDRQCKDLSGSMSALVALFRDFLNSYTGVGFV